MPQEPSLWKRGRANIPMLWGNSVIPVGLSNILDKVADEGLTRRGSLERTHREVVAAIPFDLSVMPGGVRADEPVTHAQRDSGGFKQRGFVALCLAEMIGELEAIVGLYAFRLGVSPAEKGSHFFSEACRGVRASFLVSAQETHSRKFVYGMAHLLVGLGYVFGLGLLLREHPQPAHGAIQGFWTATVSTLLQPEP